jgi:hypothetical protein
MPMIPSWIYEWNSILFYIAFVVIAALIAQRREKRARETRSTQLQTMIAILNMFENGNINLRPAQEEVN